MSDPVTLEEVEEERNKEKHREGHTEGQAAIETFGDGRAETLEEVFETVETFLTIGPPQFIGVPEDEREQIVGRLGEGLQQVDISVQSLEEILQNNQKEILARILQEQVNTSLIIRLGVQTQILQLQALFDILGSVEPFGRIVLSGTNQIESDEVDNAVPVVEDADEIDIPRTRLILIKAGDDNNGSIAFGDNDVDPDDGFILDAGENFHLAFNMAEDTLWMAGDSAGDTVEILGVV